MTTPLRISFDVACPGTVTRVDIEHRGWERLGERWRDRTRIGWQTLLPHYRKAIERG